MTVLTTRHSRFCSRGADRGQRNGMPSSSPRTAARRDRSGWPEKRAARAGLRRRRGGRAGDRLDPRSGAPRSRPRGRSSPWAGGELARQMTLETGTHWETRFGSADCGDLTLRPTRLAGRRGELVPIDGSRAARAHRPDPALPSRNGACDHAFNAPLLLVAHKLVSFACGCPASSGRLETPFRRCRSPHPARGRRTARLSVVPCRTDSRTARPGRANQAALVHGQPCVGWRARPSRRRRE